MDGSGGNCILVEICTYCKFIREKETLKIGSILLFYLLQKAVADHC
jgi:hypothetical protein